MKIESLRGLTESQLKQRMAAGKESQHATINGIRVPVRMSRYDVALMMGVTHTTVANIEKTALEKLIRALT
jgi:hypothetical protein